MPTLSPDTTVAKVLRPAAAVFLLSTLLLSFYYAAGASTATTSGTPSGGGDRELYSNVVAKLQSGVPYYDALGAELRAQGFPTASVMNWRTPLHLSVVAALHIPLAGVLLGTLGLTVLIAAAWPPAPRGKDATSWAILCLAGATVPVVLLYRDTVLFAETWCGLFIGLSLTAYARKRWVAAAVCGVLAIFVRELAAPYVLLCGLIAMVTCRRRESLVWILGGIAYFIYYAVHVSFVHAAMRAGDLSHVDSWVRWQGLPFVLSTAKWYGWAHIGPRVAIPLIVTGGLAATLARTAPVQFRLGIIVYVLTFSIIGQPFNSYWGLVTAPLWAFGLAYSLDGFRWILNFPPTQERVRLRPKSIKVLDAGTAGTPHAQRQLHHDVAL